MRERFSRRQFVTTSILLALAVVGAAVLIIWNINKPHDERIVVVYDDGVEKVIITKAETVSAALEEGSVVVGEHDSIEPSIDAKLTDSMSFVNIRRARMVAVIDSGQEKRVITAAQANSEITTAADVKLYPEDDVQFSVTWDFLNSGAALQMKITPAKVVNLTLYGQKVVLRTQKTTVAEFLKEKNIVLGVDDGMDVSGDTKIVDQMTFQIWRDGIQTISATEEVPFGIEEIKDDTKFVGFREIQNPGQNGSKSVIYEIEMKGGVEISRTKISEIITRLAVAQVEIVGTKPRSVPWTGSVDREAWLRAAGIAESDWGYVQYIIEREGGWCPVRWQNDRGCNDHGQVAPSNLGYGMFQATPGTKMASAGADWLTNPVTQIRWANGYAIGRYGSWAAAYEFKISRGWW